VDPSSQPVTIGLREIYDAVIRLGSKVDLITAQMANHDQRATDHEARLRTLERGRWPLPSLAVLVSLAAIVISVIRR
jgi:hypothetical protein